MDLSTVMFVTLALVLAAEFVNGWTDAPNAIATVIGTRVLTPRAALAGATVFNVAGALTGTAVATTIGNDIVRADLITMPTVGAAMVGIVCWSVLAWRYGLPTSESHALVAGLTGAALASAGPDALLWEGWRKVLVGLLFSTFLGFFTGLLLMVAVYWVGAKHPRPRMRKLFSRLQIFSAMFMAFSHGMNDGQKFIGAFALVLLLGGAMPAFQIPLWVVLLCALVMGVGTATGGWRIIRTLGLRLTKLDPPQGFAAETGAALTIVVASHFGIPLSTTHTISTSIMGVGATRRISAVRWGVTINIVTAWLLTFPVCALISWLATKAVMAVQPARSLNP